MTEDEQRLLSGVLPLDDVESGSIDLAGRFAEIVDRLHVSLDALSEPKKIDAWAAAIATAAHALTATTECDDWQRSEWCGPRRRGRRLSEPGAARRSAAADDHDGAVGVADAVLTDRAEQHAGERPVALAAYDQQLRIA